MNRKELRSIISDLRTELREIILNEKQFTKVNVYQKGKRLGKRVALTEVLCMLDPSYKVEADTPRICAAWDCSESFYPNPHRLDQRFHTKQCQNRTWMRGHRNHEKNYSELGGALKMKDLWPDYIRPSVEGIAPVTVLRRQAALLGPKTNNVVEARVFPNDLSEVDVSGFKYDFMIICGALGSYRYGLFSICYGIDFYPLAVHIDASILAEAPEGIEQKDNVVYAKGPAEFEKVLESIFASLKTKQIIDALLMQALDGPS